MTVDGVGEGMFVDSGCAFNANKPEQNGVNSGSLTMIFVFIIND